MRRTSDVEIALYLKTDFRDRIKPDGRACITVEERVARLEGRVEGFEGRFDSLQRRIDGLAARIEAVDQKLDRFREELAGRIDVVRQRMDALDDKLSRYLLWIIGIQVAVLLAVVGALIGS